VKKLFIVLILCFTIVTQSTFIFLGTKFDAIAGDLFDINSDNKNGIIEAIYSLQIAAGMKTEKRNVIHWSTKSSMPTPRDALGIAVVANKIYAISGRGDNAKFAFEVYNPSTDNWTKKPDIPEDIFSHFSNAIRNCGVGVVGNKIFVFSRYTSDYLNVSEKQRVKI